MSLSSFPTEQTTRTPALSIASFSPASYAVPPHEQDRMSAPLETAQLMALISSTVVPNPVSFKALIAMIFAFQQIPVTPMLLFPTAAMIPAQWVP